MEPPVLNPIILVEIIVSDIGTSIGVYSKGSTEQVIIGICMNGHVFMLGGISPHLEEILGFIDTVTCSEPKFNCC